MERVMCVRELHRRTSRLNVMIVPSFTRPFYIRLTFVLEASTEGRSFKRTRVRDSGQFLGQTTDLGGGQISRFIENPRNPLFNI
jgi:hypothetical protein